MNRNAQFVILGHNPEYILIKDIGDSAQVLTVTNDAERVYQELQHIFGMFYGSDNYRVFYEDSQGEIDEILMENNVAYFSRPTEGEIELIVRNIPLTHKGDL